MSSATQHTAIFVFKLKDQAYRVLCFDGAEGMTSETLIGSLKCCVCHRIPNSAMALSDCPHMACFDCLNPNPNKSKNKNTPPPFLCPLCQKWSRSYVPAPMIVRNMMAQLSILCPLKCPWTGKLGLHQESLGTHLNHECPNFEVQCQFDKQHRLKRREQTEHENELCADRRKPCSQCRQMVHWAEQDYHLEHECDQSVVPCPNECTNDQKDQTHGQDEKNETHKAANIKRIKRKNLIHHVNHTCPKRVMSCKYSWCKWTGRPDELLEHYATSAQQHLDLLEYQKSKEGAMVIHHHRHSHSVSAEFYNQPDWTEKLGIGDFVDVFKYNEWRLARVLRRSEKDKTIEVRLVGDLYSNSNTVKYFQLGTLGQIKPPLEESGKQLNFKWRSLVTELIC